MAGWADNARERTSWLTAWLAAAGALYLLLGALNIYWGDLNQDEGWYLYAARQVAHGAMPYRDFAFTQGPVLPLVYALFDGGVRHLGLAGGRLVTFALGFCAAVAAAALAARVAPAAARRQAAALAFMLLAGNVYQSYFTTVVKTYALCALFLAAGLLALTLVGRRAGRAAAAGAGVLLALAAGTRVSAGAAIPVAGVYLLLYRRRLPAGAWLSFGVGAALGLALVFLPFYFLAPDGVRFGLWEYHAARTAGGAFKALVYKAGFVSRTVQAYFVPVALLAGLLVWAWWRRGAGAAGPQAEPDGAPWRGLLWTVAGAVTAVHAAAPFPYDDYQALVFPVFCAALAAALAAGPLRPPAAAADARRGRQAGLALVFLVSLLAAFSSPINQSWAIIGRDRIWWRMKTEAPLQRLRHVGSWISEYCQPGDVLLTQDTYLAVEADLRVPAGWEMGPFSYFPEMDRARAERLRVVNRDMLLAALQSSPAPFAALSGYGLAIRSPQVDEVPAEDRRLFEELLRARYEELCVVPDFGQAFTPLRLYRKKATGAAVP